VRYNELNFELLSKILDFSSILNRKNKDWTTPDSRNTPSTTNLEEEETVDVPGNDGNASMPEHVKRPNQWRKMMMMMIIK